MVRCLLKKKYNLTHLPAEPSPLIASLSLGDENVDERFDAAESAGDDESAGRAAG